MIAVVIYYGVRVKWGSEWQIRLIRFLPAGQGDKLNLLLPLVAKSKLSKLNGGMVTKT